MDSSPPSIALRIAVFALGALSLTGGWIIVCLGGFFHSPAKYTTATIFVSGPPAAFMALFQFALATLAFMWLARLRYGSTASCLIALCVVFLPPSLYLAIG